MSTNDKTIEILALGIQKLMEKEAAQNQVILKLAEVSDIQTAALAALLKGKEEAVASAKTDKDVDAKTDEAIIKALQEDLEKSRVAEDTSSQEDKKDTKQEEEEVEEGDSKIASSLLDKIESILNDED